MDILAQKEQQIEAQRQTIESLRKNVERLEIELQKCLDPGGDYERTLTGAYQFTLPVTTTRKPVSLPKTEHLRDRIELAIQSLFIPTTYRDHTNETHILYQSWWGFRDVLFEFDIFNDHWSRPEFRDGVELLNSICQATEVHPEKIMKDDTYELALNLFDSGSEKWTVKKTRGLQALIDAIAMVHDAYTHQDERPDYYWPVSNMEINEMRSVLIIVQYLQSLWMNAEPQTETKGTE